MLEGVREKPAGAFVHATVSGSSYEQVADRLSNYLLNYPKQGYMTEVLIKIRETQPGHFEALVRRYASCD